MGIPHATAVSEAENGLFGLASLTSPAGPKRYSEALGHQSAVSAGIAWTLKVGVLVHHIFTGLTAAPEHTTLTEPYHWDILTFVPAWIEPKVELLNLGWTSPYTF